MSLTPYPTLRLKLTMPQAIKLNFRDASIGTGLNSISNAMLADMAPWTYKIRNGASTGDPNDAAVGNFTTAIPTDSDYVTGFQATGEIRKFAVGNLKSIGSEVLITLADGPTVLLDASIANVFHLTAAGDRTILAPMNVPGVGRTQKLIIRHQASGANRTLTLAAGIGGFRFGTTVTGLTTTVGSKTDYIGCIWNQPVSQWDVVAYAKGF